MNVTVLHVLPHPGGGAETYIDLLERIQGYNHERMYLSAGRRPHEAIGSLPTRWPRIAASARGAELIHCHGDIAGVLGLPLLRYRPAVLTTHGLHLIRRIRNPGRMVMNAATATVVASCRSVICTSASERDELAMVTHSRDLAKLRVIHNGIDPPAAANQSQRASTRAAMGIGPDVVLGLFVGALEARKAPLLAASAARDTHAAGVPFVLAVAGDGPQACQLQALEGDAVKVLGHRSDVPRLLAAADVFVQPSEREGMSFALLEAMAHGVAVIAADIAGNTEAVGDAGVCFRPGERQALTAAMVRLSSDRGLRASLGATAREKALGEFSAAACIAATEAVYEDAVKEPARAAIDVRA